AMCGLSDFDAGQQSEEGRSADHLNRYLFGGAMTTKLDGELKRELSIGGEAYTLTLSPTGFTLAPKGRRKGLDIKWADLVSGEAALATALNAALTANIAPARVARAPHKAKPNKR